MKYENALDDISREKQAHQNTKVELQQTKAFVEELKVKLQH